MKNQQRSKISNIQKSPSQKSNVHDISHRSKMERKTTYRKFVVVISIFQIVVAILFAIFVRYDRTIDPKFQTSNNTISDNFMNDYSRKFRKKYFKKTKKSKFHYSDFGYSSHVEKKGFWKLLKKEL